MTEGIGLPQRAVGVKVRFRPLAAGWTACLCLYAAFGLWLAGHPAALPSDDALFFARGLLDFDVLDLSPQFPGYPAFIALGRLILPFADGPVAALFDLTVVIALALPPVAALLAWRISGSHRAALAAFAVTLTMPLLPDLALSLLSDGSGILFLLVSLALLPAAQGAPFPARQARAGAQAMAGLAGVALGLAACCRPSDAALFTGVFAIIAWRLPRLVPAFVGGAAVVVLPALAVIYALEGRLYLWEATHFIAGHATVWGNTVFAAHGPRENWLDAIASLPGGIAIGVLLTAAAVIAATRCREIPTAVAAMAVGFIVHAVWVTLMQNPDHLRHLAPLAILGGLVLVLIPVPAIIRNAAICLLLALQVHALARTIDAASDSLPPLAQAVEFLANTPDAAAVALNNGVAVLRQELPTLQIYDMQNPAHAALGLAGADGQAYRLSTTPLAERPAAIFPARLLGEKTMYLYQAAKHPANPDGRAEF